ncbi:Exosome non-catalytic core component [Elasticomyces elasticus]|nr:Exosome non-catalytic core component [Elasticomyces elasticus]KAK4914708.1 Exosome non-catalytic core component [Elasticomyces elasticus]KAK5759203.1 Exosome non-catalytic core component [Elasticomyces elasticus]
MPLDTSTYSLAHLRLDGRRWNELRRLSASISTSGSADGSSYLEQGNTKILCTITGPQEQKQGGARRESNEAKVEVEINVAAFSGVDRKRRARGDRRSVEMQHTIATAFQGVLFTHLYPHSTVVITLHVLSQDGSLLACCLNAATLALIDAGIPMSDYVSACTVASSPTSSEGDGVDATDPLLDLNGVEEQELAFLTIGTSGEEGKVLVLVMETRCRVERLEGMMAVGLEGCGRIRGMLDGVVREHGGKVLEARVG